jgi:hypothetical protein
MKLYGLKIPKQLNTTAKMRKIEISIYSTQTCKKRKKILKITATGLIFL